jgi:hypothetical protein
LFYTGRKSIGNRVSRFYATPIGKNTLADVSKNVAAFLDLPNHKNIPGTALDTALPHRRLMQVSFFCCLHQFE